MGPRYAIRDSKPGQPDGPGIDFPAGRPDEALAGEGVKCANWQTAPGALRVIVVRTESAGE